ncbi:flagellar FliJ family protein [Sphingobium sp. Cam5-1]|nr:flagellar FliJ family protein [Sphingobium sp. Cam5-1]QPI72026.1 flagellar FliJ family protein [Sphingobium sp. Cam5-1]
MKGPLKTRQRVLRVRHVQHAMAVAETARARDEADGIERNADRLRKVRSDLFSNPGMATGANFAAMQELAGRLEQAGRQLDGALYDARRKVEAKEGLTLAANRDREIAEKLKDRARADLEEWRETKLAALPRYRRMQRTGDV